jgi:hypothetical protein
VHSVGATTLCFLSSTSTGAEPDYAVGCWLQNLEETRNFVEGRAQIVPRRSIHEIKIAAPTVAPLR